SSPVADITEDEKWIAHLIVVEDVREDSGEFRAEAFGHLDVLLHAEVNIPEGQTAQLPCSAIVPLIDSQNRVAETAIGRFRVGKVAGSVPVTSKIARSRGVVVPRSTE